MINAVFLVFNILGIFFILLPSGWHWRVKNTATLLYIFWCTVTVIPAAINSIIWYNTVENVAPIWCDVRTTCDDHSSILRGESLTADSQIVTKIRIGGDVGIPAATLCITRQLESIAAARQVNFSAADRRRRNIVDLLIGIGSLCFSSNYAGIILIL